VAVITKVTVEAIVYDISNDEKCDSIKSDSATLVAGRVLSCSLLGGKNYPITGLPFD